MRKLLSILLALLVPSAVIAAVTSTPIFMQTPRLGVVQFLQGTDAPSTYKTIFTGGTNGSRCSGISISSLDPSTDHVVAIQISRSGTAYGGTSVTVPKSSGYSGTVYPVSAMLPSVWPGLPVDASGNPYVNLENGDLLRAAYATALTAATYINVLANCGDF